MEAPSIMMKFKNLTKTESNQFQVFQELIKDHDMKLAQYFTWNDCLINAQTADQLNK